MIQYHIINFKEHVQSHVATVIDHNKISLLLTWVHIAISNANRLFFRKRESVYINRKVYQYFNPKVYQFN